LPSRGHAVIDIGTRRQCARRSASAIILQQPGHPVAAVDEARGCRQRQGPGAHRPDAAGSLARL